MSQALKIICINTILNAKSGHPGMPLGIADVLSVLIGDHVKISVKNPKWINRDRMVFSAGHMSMGIYAYMHLLGYDNITEHDINSFRQIHSNTPGHPETITTGIEATTGPLGQGIGNGIGMAISEAKAREILGEDIINHNIYIIASDGCMMEGISHEVCSLAGTLNLSKVILIYDSNDNTIEGNLNITDKTNNIERFKSYGWHTIKIDGHNTKQIDEAITEAKSSDKPTLIECKTILGKGMQIENTHNAHSAPINESEREYVSTRMEDFDMDEARAIWGECAEQKEIVYHQWLEKIQNTPEIQSRLNQYNNHDYESSAIKTLNNLKNEAQDVPDNTNRKHSQKVVDAISKAYSQYMIFGSADLGSSCGVKSKHQTQITHNHYNGNYIEYGIREHGMVSVMNGIQLSEFFRTVGSSFLIFSDYCKPSIRLSALMELNAIFVFTHDSIGVGEDGPTHQPIEQLSGLIAIPNLTTIRPSDYIEVIEAWQHAIQMNTAPTVISLSRHATPNIFVDRKDNLIQYGGYLIDDSVKLKDKTFTPSTGNAIDIIATGSELHIALEVVKLLRAKHNIDANIISMPSISLFKQQSAEYKAKVLNGHYGVVIEAAASDHWYQIIYKYKKHVLCCIDTFGVSGPQTDVYNHFKLNTKSISERIIKEIHQQ